MKRILNRSTTLFPLPALGLVALLLLLAPALYADWCSDVGCDNACDRCRTLDDGGHTCCLGCKCLDQDEGVFFTSNDPLPEILLSQLQESACPEQNDQILISTENDKTREVVTGAVQTAPQGIPQSEETDLEKLPSP